MHGGKKTTQNHWRQNGLKWVWVGSGPGGIFTSRPVSGLRPFNITAWQETRTNVGKRCYRLPTDCRAEYGVGLQHATVRETNAQQRSRQYCPLVTPPPPPVRGAEYCDERVCVCLSAITSSELHVRPSPYILCVLSMAVSVLL